MKEEETTEMQCRLALKYYIKAENYLSKCTQPDDIVMEVINERIIQLSNRIKTLRNEK